MYNIYVQHSVSILLLGLQYALSTPPRPLALGRFSGWPNESPAHHSPSSLAANSQLWRRFHSALAWVLEEADEGDLFDGVDSAVVGECLDEFKDFYTSRWRPGGLFFVCT